MKTTRSFRIDSEDLKKANELKINLNPIVKEAIKKAIKAKRCPFCKGELK